MEYMRRELLIGAKILALENTLTDTIAHSTAPSASRDLVVTLTFSVIGAPSTNKIQRSFAMNLAVSAFKWDLSEKIISCNTFAKCTSESWNKIPIMIKCWRFLEDQRAEK